MGFLLIGVTLLIVILAVIVTRRASEIFGRLQRLLDRMNVVLREKSDRGQGDPCFPEGKR